MIRPYLSDMINDHNVPMKLRVYSNNKVTDYETQFGEWKIQLTMQINFISSKDFEETCTKHTKSDNIEIMIGNTKERELARKSKYNYKRDNQVILLMITDGEKWHYLAVKILPALLRGIPSNHNGDFYCSNCFHS